MFTPGLNAGDHHLTTEQAIQKAIEMGHKVTFEPHESYPMRIKIEPMGRSSIGSLIDVTEYNTMSNALTTLLGDI